MSRKVVIRSFAVLALLLLLCLGWASFAAVRTRADVLAARATLSEVRTTAEPTTALPAALSKAALRLQSARQRMNQPGPWISARLPLIGRSFVAVRDTAGAAEAVVDAASTVLAATDTSALISGGGFDIAALTKLEAALTSAAERTTGPLRRLRELRTGLTPAPVGRGIAQARNELGTLDTTLANGAALVRALRGISGGEGPQSILFVLQNNAELRGTGGFISTFAEATGDRGQFTIKEFRDIENIAATPDRVKTVDAPADYIALYGGNLANTTLWKNANMSPHGPSSLAVLAKVAAATLKSAPQAVVAIDVPAIAEILRATGPVQLPDGQTLSADNAIDELLVKAYEVPDDAQHERRRRLRVAATAVIRQLLQGAPTVPLIRALQTAAAGRHLMLWSAKPEWQQAFHNVGATGAIPPPDPDIAMMTIHNLGATEIFTGNKLDYYAARELDVTVVLADDSATTTQRWTLRNNAPTSGLVEYVAGTIHPGRTRSQVRFSVPAEAELTGYARNSVRLVPQKDTEVGHRVLSDVVTLDPGQSATWTISYSLPVKGGRYGLWLVPQPLAKPASLSMTFTIAEGSTLASVGTPPPSGPQSWTAVVHPTFVIPDPSWTQRVGEWFRRPVRVG